MAESIVSSSGGLACALLIMLVSALAVETPTGARNRLTLNDPAVYERTRALAGSSLTLKESHPTSALKRQAAVTNFIRIGQMTETIGPSAAYAKLQMNAWDLWLSRNPTLTVRGVVYGIQLFVYSDGSFPPDPTTTIVALTEWMITHDKCHIVSTGIQGLNYAMEQTADALGVPCINTGDYNAGFLPSQNFSLYLLPDLTEVAVCTTALLRAGASTFVEFADPAGFLQNIYIPTVQSMGGIIKAQLNVTPEMRYGGPDRYQPLVDQIKAQQPFDVLMGSTTEGVNPEGTNLDFMQALHQNDVNPKAVIIWNIASYPVYRTNGTWQVAGQMLGEAYQPSINQSDPVWGSSLKYDADYRARFGIASGTNDAAVAGAITMLVVGLNNSAVDLANSTSILLALNSVNTSSIFGPLFFVENKVRRTMYCFQTTFPNASNILAVWPNTSSAYVPITYPAYAQYPDGWLARYAAGKNWTLTIILVCIFGVIGVLLILGLIGFLLVKGRYNTVFIPRDKMNEEWGSPH